MRTMEIIVDACKNNNNIITTEQFLKLGYSKTTLSNYVNAGLLERINHGIYCLPKTVYDDMYILSLRSKKIIFSHETALFLNDLSERTPFQHSITIPSNSSLPNTLKRDCACFYVKEELHSLGKIQKKTTFGNEVCCYDAERTICDLLRSRNRCEDEVFLMAIKRYLNSNHKNLSNLYEYARQFHVDKNLRNYLEVLL